MQEKFRAEGKKVYFGFVDLEKAFDRVPREVIRWAMCNLGVEEWLISTVMSVYTGAKTVARTVYGNSHHFEVKISMYQGSALTHTHIHTQLFLRLFWILSRTTQVSWYWKDKTNLGLLEQEIVSGSGICWAICKSAPHPRQPHQHPTAQFFLQAGCPSCRPTNSVKAFNKQQNYDDNSRNLNYFTM